ncbi:MAG: hypothetical protein ACRCS9_13780 [Hyphomicrobium sp.]
MSDRTQLAIGRSTWSVPKLTKRAYEALIATGVTSIVALFVLVLNGALTGRGTWMTGFDIWLSFIQRPDILGTIILTALCTVFTLQWLRDRVKR